MADVKLGRIRVCFYAGAMKSYLQSRCMPYDFVVVAAESMSVIELLVGRSATRRTSPIKGI
jgi:hypothetical protein